MMSITSKLHSKKLNVNKMLSRKYVIKIATLCFSFIKKARSQKLTKEHVANRKFTTSFTHADYKKKLKNMTNILNEMGVMKTTELWLEVNRNNA